MPTRQLIEVTPASRMANVHYAIRDLAVVAEKVAREHKILYLNIGDPPKYDFPTPPHLIEAVHKAMVDGFNGYADSLGYRPAVEAIRNDAESHGFSNIQGIFVGYGTGEVIDSCLTSLVNPGDNVLTPSPEYPLYSAMLAKVGATLNAYDLDEENGWQPDLVDLEAKINDRTRAILLINPNNPTGAVYTRDTIEKIAELARRHNLLIFADEIYDKLIFDDDVHHTSIAAVAPDIPVITFNGLSKAYLAPGWRIGWAIATGPAEALTNYLESIYKLLRARLSAPYPFQFAIKPALEGPQDHLNSVRAKLRARRDITVEWAKKAPRVSLVAPKGAFYAFPRIDVPVTDLEFVTGLVQSKHVLVVHGSGFGQKPGTQHFRIVFLPPDNVLRAAYDGITEYIQEKYA